MPLNPDTHTQISLIGTAERLHSARGDRDAAVGHLQGIAAGRTDLLAEAAGHFLGADAWNSAPCHQLLLDAGADLDLIEAAAEQTRRNRRTSGYTSEGTGGPRGGYR